MDVARRPTPAQVGVRLVALVLLLACFVNVAISPSSTALAAVCAGDEQIVLAPYTPRVGGRLLVAVFSQAAHEQAVLIGPAGPIPVARAQIGDGFVWQEMVALEQAGEHVFVFGLANGSAPFTSCAVATILVAEADASPLFASLHPYGQNGANGTGQSQPAGGPGEPGTSDTPSDPEGDAVELTGGDESPGAPRQTTRRAPTRTPTPRPDNENENGNDNEAEATPTRTPTSTRVPTSTRTPRPTATDTPEPTPTLGPASISSLSPSRPICGQALAINGDRFGNSRSDVDGEVRIDGREASIDSWSMERIRVTVPLNVRGGNSRQIDVRVSGRTASMVVAITC